MGFGLSLLAVVLDTFIGQTKLGLLTVCYKEDHTLCVSVQYLCKRVLGLL